MIDSTYLQRLKDERDGLLKGLAERARLIRDQVDAQDRANDRLVEIRQQVSAHVWGDAE